MSMFKWGASYINPVDVVLISTGSNSAKPHPFYMTVRLRGKETEFQSWYSTESARDTDAARLAALVGKYQEQPVTRYEVEAIVNKAKDAIRRDIKALHEKER